jgi:uncharacterized coiled-coil protein SlyX/outer membrane murein-binding lipoprotein Lpp
MCSADRIVLVAVTCTGILMVAGCASSGSAAPGGMTAGQVQDYLAQVEPVRRSVNDLLEGADPILQAYRSHQISPHQAARRMSDLEARFAVQGATVEAISSPEPTLESIHRTYAHTYQLEDAYLRALTAALPDGDFSDLPNTQDAQRLAITAWRKRLEVLAQQTGATLPDDLQQAGRGEIAPSPTGS